MQRAKRDFGWIVRGVLMLVLGVGYLCDARVGQTSEDGHNFLYLAIPRWQNDVFGFLDEHVKR